MLDQLFASVGLANDQNLKKEVAIAEQKKGLANQNIDIAEAMMESSLLPAATKREGDFAAQEAGIAVRDQLGNNPNDPNSLIALLTQDFRENTIAARQQQQSIAEKQQVGLFDDPLQYMVNYVLLPDEINAANATQAKADFAKSKIAEMQSLTTASAQAQNATARSLTNESLAASARVDIANSVMKLNEAKIASLGYDSEAIKAIEASNAQALELGVKRAHLDMAAAQNARASEAHKFQMNHLKAQAAADEKKADKQVELLKVINQGAAVMGQKPIDQATFEWWKNDPKQRGKLEIYYEQGAANLLTGSKVPGNSSGEAILNVLEVDGLQGPQNKPAKQFLQSVALEVYNALGKPKTNTPEGKAALAKGIDDMLLGVKGDGKNRAKIGTLSQMANNVETPGNLYKASDLPQLANLPAVRNNPLYDSVIAPAVASGQKESNPERILALALAARNAGKITNNQLDLGIAEFYKAASAEAYTSRGLGKVGLPYYGSYVAQVPSAFSISSEAKDKIDWARPESILSYRTALEAGRRLHMIGVPE